MTPDLDELIAALAAHLAHSRGLSPASAERVVRKLVDEAWVDYCELGAPLGDDDTGLARWILTRPRRPPAA
jgi:hypothetical protein